jgi:hypothetical protein
MMKTKYVYGGAKTALDLPVAAFAGVAVGFVVFAMPGWRFEQLVGLSGLPAVLAAAQPPLGWTARIAVAVAGAAAAFALALITLRISERLGSRGGRAQKAEELPEAVPIRRRRFDSHPDAPPRPPVSAKGDFGEPAADGTESPAPRPFWLPDDFPEVEREEADRWEAEREDHAEAEDEPPLDLADFPAEPEYARAREPVPAATDEPPAADQAEPRAADHAEPPQAESIAELMARLERGLSASAPTHASAPEPFPAAQAPADAFSEATEDRLRSAIDGLRRLARRS